MGVAFLSITRIAVKKARWQWRRVGLPTPELPLGQGISGASEPRAGPREKKTLRAAWAAR